MAADGAAGTEGEIMTERQNESRGEVRHRAQVAELARLTRKAVLLDSKGRVVPAKLLAEIASLKAEVSK